MVPCFAEPKLDRETTSDARAAEPISANYKQLPSAWTDKRTGTNELPGLVSPSNAAP